MKIANLKKLSKPGKLKAYFDVETPKLTIYGCKLLEGNDGNLWAAMPSREYLGKDGEKKYAPIIALDEELRNKVTALAREAYGEKVP